MLQFHLTNFFGTKFKTHGIAIPKEEGLQLVFRDGQAPAKLFDEDIQSILIDWKNFQGMQIKKGLFGTVVNVTVISANALGDFPAIEQDTITLKIHRSNVQDFEPFERAVNEYRTGRIDEDVDDFVDDVRDFLHGR